MKPLKPLKEWRRRTRATVGSVAAAALAAVPLANLHHGWRVGEAAVVVGLAAFVYLLARAETRSTAQRAEDARQAAIDARQNADVALTDSLQPLLDLLAEMATHPLPDRQVMASQVVTAAVQTVASTVGPERTRACFFRLERADDRLQLAVPAGGYAGRGQGPSRPFREGTAIGDAAVEAALTGGSQFVYDTEDSPPPGWAGARSYRTFLSVAVRSGERAYGLLTVDATAPGDLDESTDVPFAKVMASLIGVALALAEA